MNREPMTATAPPRTSGGDQWESHAPAETLTGTPLVGPMSNPADHNSAGIMDDPDTDEYDIDGGEELAG